MSLRDEVTAEISPGDDFYNYVNKKWRDAHSIPNDKSSSSALSQLGDMVTDQLHELLEKPVGGTEAANSSLAKMLYASGMNEAATEKRSFSTLALFIREIEGLQNASDVKALIMQRHSMGLGSK